MILNTLTSTIQYLEQKFLPNKIRNYQERYEFVIGQTILHYKILEKLGEGGMGVVYKAEDTKLQRTVALKFLPLNLAGDDELRKRFINEARTASALNHPNICTIHAVEDGEQPFIAMEFVEGKELRDLVGAQHAVPLRRDVINYATQIAEGLQAAHKKASCIVRRYPSI